MLVCPGVGVARSLARFGALLIKVVFVHAKERREKSARTWRGPEASSATLSPRRRNTILLRVLFSKYTAYSVYFQRVRYAGNRSEQTGGGGGSPVDFFVSVMAENFALRYRLLERGVAGGATAPSVRGVYGGGCRGGPCLGRSWRGSKERSPSCLA